MKKIDKDFQNPPAILLNRTRLEKIKLALANQNAHHIRTNHYAPKAVKLILELIYNGKCGYCESTVKQVSMLQGEHYRPKNGVADDPAHRGYFWLALEWSNIVLGCPACNGQGAKGNRFPVAGARVFIQDLFDEAGQFQRAALFADGEDLLGEQPFLLHPEIDEPKDHLKFTTLAILEGKTDRGTRTIEICDLNRDSLIEARQGIINDFLEQCKIIFAGKLRGNLKDEGVGEFLKAQLKLMKTHRDNPKEPYTTFREYLLENPETCILPGIEPAFHSDFRRAFEQFRLEEMS